MPVDTAAARSIKFRNKENKDVVFLIISVLWSFSFDCFKNMNGII